MYKEEKEVRVNRRIIVRKFGREASFLLLFFFFLIIHSIPLQAKGGRFEANNATNNNSLCT